MRTTFMGAMCLWIVLVASAEAQDAKGGGDLATAATNPVGSANQLQLQNTFIPSSKNSDGGANTAIIQPVVAFDIGEDSYFQGIVTRTTLPIITTPEIADDRVTGTGDITSLIIPTHSSTGSKPGEFTTWGPIGAVVIPTASEDRTGADVWSFGPGLIGLKNVTFENGNSLMFGGLAYHVWDVESDGDVSVTSGFPIVIYKFGSLFGQKGWYLRLPDDLWQYDWNRSEFTQLPVGGDMGRAFTIGEQLVNVYGGGWYNAADPDEGSVPQYAVKLSFSLVFPK
jgi:hypothetical protein